MKDYLLIITLALNLISCSNKIPLPKTPKETKRYAINKKVPPEIKEVTIVKEIYE